MTGFYGLCLIFSASWSSSVLGYSYGLLEQFLRTPMDTKTSADEMPVLNFIRDVPATKDAFGSHSRIAKALATAIHTQKDLKVVGLLGPWGSGKSTVVKLARPNWRRPKASRHTSSPMTLGSIRAIHRDVRFSRRLSNSCCRLAKPDCRARNGRRVSTS